MTKTLREFKLQVIEGEFTNSQIIVMLGENGSGKTTFMRMLVLVFIIFTLFIQSYVKLHLDMWSHCIHLFNL